MATFHLCIPHATGLWYCFTGYLLVYWHNTLEHLNVVLLVILLSAVKMSSVRKTSYHVYACSFHVRQ